MSLWRSGGRAADVVALQMVRAHRKTLQNQDHLIAFVLAAAVCCALAGLRLRGNTDASTKLVSLILSFMWASQGVLLFGETCRTAMMTPGKLQEVAGGHRQWPVEGLVASFYFAAQSLVLTVLSQSSFLRFYRPYMHLRQSEAHQIGLFLMVLCASWCVGHWVTKGAHCKLAFPLDLFTIALLLGASEDSGYAKQALLLPIIGMGLRCSIAAASLDEREEVPMAFVALICFYVRDQWGRRRDAYVWPQLRGRNQRDFDYGDVKTGGAGGGTSHVRVPRWEPMMREVAHGGDGGVQGLSWVREMQLVDEDGDEAMEFFDVTDEGLRKRVVTHN